MVKRLTTAYTAEEENSYRSYVEYTLIGLFGDIPKYHSFLSSAGFTNQSGNDIISKKKKKKKRCFGDHLAPVVIIAFIKLLPVKQLVLLVDYNHT